MPIYTFTNKIKDLQRTELSVAVDWKDKSNNETIDWFQGQTNLPVNFD